jgi:2-polyprenyl-3-methyl-5-hydroxy-6-metoxy-1,4-benzoquinol methylase
VFYYGCGIGRHSIPLAKRGFQIKGIDLSPAMLEVAKKNSSSMENISFQNQDIRKISLDKKDYDSAICMWTTYNYLSTEDNLKDFFDGLGKHIKSEGLLVLDAKNIFNLDNIRAYSRIKKDNDNEVLLLVIKKIIKNVQNGFYLYFIKNNNKKIEFIVDEELARFYTPEQITELSQGQFKIVDIFGDFDFSHFDKNKSERMIIVLRKN